MAYELNSSCEKKSATFLPLTHTPRDNTATTAKFVHVILDPVIYSVRSPFVGSNMAKTLAMMSGTGITFFLTFFLTSNFVTFQSSSLILQVT